MLWVAQGKEIFRRFLGKEAGAVDMLGSTVVSGEDMHHGEVAPHHEDQKHKISNQCDTEK
jgi:hypothetical protein